MLLDRAESLTEAEAEPLVSAAWALEHGKRESLRRLAELAASDEGWAGFLRLLDAPEVRAGDRLAFADLLEELADAEGPAPLRGGSSRLGELARLGDDLERSRLALDAGSASGTRGGSAESEWARYLQELRASIAVEDLLEELRRKGLLGRDGDLVLRGEDGRVFGYGLPEKHVVLTFDDGPHPKYTAQILDILEQHGAPAVFFTVGENLGKLDPDGTPVLGSRAALARRAYRSGHALANHSFNHPQMPKLEEAERVSQIESTNGLLSEITGAEVPYFRPPYGAVDAALLELVRDEQMKAVLWNVDSLDWGDPLPRSIAERVVARLEKEGRGILLFHDIHRQTVDALPFILQELQARGYRFADLAGNVTPPTAPPSEVLTARAPGPDRPSATAGEPGAYYRKSWALVVGINAYRHWPQLGYAVDDARSVSKILVERFGFPEENVFTLFDEEATRDKIVELLGGVLADPDRVGPDDRLVVFFAGHGATRALPSGGELGYLVPVDAELSSYQTRAISMTQLRDFSELIPAKHVLYIMDSCYSGIALTRGTGMGGGGAEKYLREVTRRRARQILTAGGAEQAVADNGPGGHSIFTWTLLQGLQGLADMDGNGFVTATELGAFVAPVVSRYSEQTPAFGNLVGSEGGELVFAIDYETLSDLSRQLDAQAAELQSELEAVQRRAMANLETSLELSRDLGASAGESEEAKSARLAQANRHHALGLQYFREKRYELAATELERAVVLNPENPTIVNNYGFLAYRRGRFQEAVDYLERTVALDPERAVAYLNLGDALVPLGRDREAADAYRKYLELWPDSPRAGVVRSLLERLEAP